MAKQKVDKTTIVCTKCGKEYTTRGKQKVVCPHCGKKKPQVVICPKCGQQHKTTGQKQFRHCGETFDIKDHRLIEPKMVKRGRGKVCSISGSRLKYNSEIEGHQCNYNNCKYKNRCPGIGHEKPLEDVVKDEDNRVHKPPYGFAGQSMEIIEGRTNPDMPPKSMMSLLIGEHMHLDGFKFVQDQDKEQPSKIYYSNKYDGIVFEYFNLDGQKITIILEELETHEGYYNLPSNHPQRDEVFVYHHYGEVKTFSKGGYHIKVDGNGNPRLVHSIIFWSKDYGFFFYNTRKRTIKGFEFEPGKKYKYFQPGELEIKEGELFSEISQHICYKVIETLRNETNHRDNKYYGYLVEHGNIDTVKAIAQRLTRPGQMQHYPGLSRHQRSLLYEKGIVSSYEPKTTVFVPEYSNDTLEEQLEDLRKLIGLLGSVVDMTLDDYFKLNPSDHKGTYVTERAFFKDIESALRACGFFRLKDSFELFEEFKSETKKLINENSHELADERNSRSKFVNEWYKIDDVYSDFKNIEEFIGDSMYIEDVIEDLKAAHEYMINSYYIINGLSAMSFKNDEKLGSIKNTINFLIPFDEGINVEQWINAEYLKWNEMQSQEDDALDVWEDDDFIVTDIPKLRHFYSHLFELSKEGHKKLKYLGDRIPNKDMKIGTKPIIFKGFVGKNPFPQFIRVEGAKVFNKLKDEDDIKESVIRKLAFHDTMPGSKHPKDTQITIIYKDGDYDKTLMDPDYSIKVGLKTTAIVGASQVAKNILVQSHEQEDANGNIVEVIDGAPLIKAIMGYLKQLSTNRPEVVLCGMATGVDMAAAIAVLLLNEIYGWNIRLVFCSPGNVIEELVHKTKSSFFGYCYDKGHTFISFLREEYEFDETLVDENSLHYYLRNEYMANNANIVVDFMSKNVGGSKATCELKERARKAAQQKRAQAKAARETARRAAERDGLSSNKEVYFTDLAKILDREADKLDGGFRGNGKPRGSKPKHVLSKYMKQEPVYDFDKPIIVSSNKEDDDGLVHDYFLCQARAAIVRTFAYDKDIGYGQGKAYFRWACKDIIQSIRIIMGCDYDSLIPEPVKATFSTIVGEEDMAKLDELCSDDKSEEYYELLGKHYHRVYDIEPPSYMAPCHGKKDVYYGDLFNYDHQRVPSHFIEVRNKLSHQFESNTSSKYALHKRDSWTKVLYNVDKYPIIIPGVAINYTGWYSRIFNEDYIHNGSYWQRPHVRGTGSLGGTIRARMHTEINGMVYEKGDIIHKIKPTYEPGPRYIVLFGDHGSEVTTPLKYEKPFKNTPYNGNIISLKEGINRKLEEINREHEAWMKNFHAEHEKFLKENK